jgi:hypothetical protein
MPEGVLSVLKVASLSSFLQATKYGYPGWGINPGKQLDI